MSGNERAEVVSMFEADGIPDGMDASPPCFSEDNLALRFSTQYAEDFRYVAKWGKWLRWDGIRWAEDSTLHIFDLAREVCREASAECSSDKEAVRLCSKATRAAVENLAQADRRHAATVEQWNQNPMLLNTPKGTVDLTSGELKAHSRNDYITKVTRDSPADDLYCPQWHAFLKRITGDNKELPAFLQRVIGYALTGITQENALFFLFGTGQNGKSTFLNTVSKLLGDYARTAPIETFVASRNEHHPTDLAGLQGARLVTAIETEDGRRWAESKLKALTGGDRISARFMRQDFFDYVPQFKIMIAGNHKPRLRTVDEAIRSRFNLLPFTVTIPQNERDRRLEEKLAKEWPAILRWAIDGCLDWQKSGLNAPKVVEEATKAYMDAEDNIGRWIEEGCLTGNQYSTSFRALYASYKDWCEGNKEFILSGRKFSEALEAKGLVKDHGRKGQFFVGIVLQKDVL